MATYDKYGRDRKRCSVCGLEGSVDILALQCHICEKVFRYKDCVWRCGYPFCNGCVVRWFGTEENFKSQHPLQPCLVCERALENQAIYAGRFPKVLNPLYFPPVWHYSQGGPPAAGTLCMHVAPTTIAETNFRRRPTPEMNTRRQDQVYFTKWPPGPVVQHCSDCTRPELCFECIYRKTKDATCDKCIYHNYVRSYDGSTSQTPKPAGQS